ARVGALDVGFVPGEGGSDTAGILSGDKDVVVLLGADDVDLSRLGNKTVIYVGHHGDQGAVQADIVLPCAAYTEMDATFVNTEGRVQMTRRGVQPKGEAREGWAIFRALSDVLGKPLAYDTAKALRDVLREGEASVFAGLGYAPGAAGVDALRMPIEASGTVSAVPLTSPITDFYFTNAIARASKTMAECSQQKRGLETPVAAE
ncbi:MAG: molybdopterin-dependent oxidoreductase, partial [Pseudomonadota bacterium]